MGEDRLTGPQHSFNWLSSETGTLRLFSASPSPRPNREREDHFSLGRVHGLEPVNFLATRVALWPPNPNELFTTAFTFICRAVLGT